jgi:hypothetical protein
VFISLTRFRKPNTSQQHASNFWRQQEGLAVLIAVMAVSVFSLLGLYVSLNATTEVRISENYESQQQADLAARAGLNHARELIQGELQFNELLKRSDGTSRDSDNPSTLSGKYAFRNSFLDWSKARSVNIVDPTNDVRDLPDYGLFKTADGTILVPATGVALTAPDPYGTGTVTTARYFLKVTDNDDGDGDAFTDSDGIVVVRSTGVARTIRDTGRAVRANSVAVYESTFKEFKELRSFNVGASVVTETNQVQPTTTPMFIGSSFNINGGTHPYGIATIDTNTSDSNYPAAQIKKHLSPERYRNIKGTCCSPTQPAIGDITAGLSSDQRRLLDPKFLSNLAYDLMPKFADNVYQGNQSWSEGTTLDLGYYNPSKPLDDPSQRFKTTYVNGDLSVSGTLSGAGVLLVTGKLSMSGSFHWSGLILVIGQGSVNATGGTVEGSIYVVNLQTGNSTIGTPNITISGNSSFNEDDNALQGALGSVSPAEMSRREVTSLIDP